MPPHRGDRWPGPLLDPDSIKDKRAYEQEIFDRFQSMLRTFEPGYSYVVDLVGTYPNTIVKVAGPSIRTRRQHEWEFKLWDFWENGGDDVEGTAAVLYANLDT